MDVKAKIRKSANIILVIGLCLMLACSGIAYIFSTSVGKTVNREISYETEYGTLAGTVYKPQRAYPVAALADNSTAGVVLAHDYGGNRENMSMPAIELSKRGFTVFAIDLYGHGHSTLKTHFEGEVSELEELNAGGVWDAVKYLRNLTYVNNDKISIVVHGNSELNLASKAVELDNAQWDNGGARWIAGVFFVGNEPTETGETLLRNRDAGILLSKNSEYGNNKDYLSSNSARDFVNTYQRADARVAAGEEVKNGLESLKTPGYNAVLAEKTNVYENLAAETSPLSIPSALAEEMADVVAQNTYAYATAPTVTYQWTRIDANNVRTTVTGAAGTGATFALTAVDRLAGAKVEVKISVVFMSGTVATSFRSVYLANVSHANLSNSFSGAKAYINFFGMGQQIRQSAYLTASAEATSEIGQTWWIKEAMTGAALVGFFMFVVGAVLALYDVVTSKKLEASTSTVGDSNADAEIVVAEKPFAPDAPNSKAGRLIYWISFGLTIVLSGIFFWLAFQAGGGAVSNGFNGYFNQPITNGILTALIVTGVIGLGLFVLSAFLNKKFANGGNLKESLTNGLPSKASNIIKSLLIAIGVVFAGFCIQGFVQWLWQVDFRFGLWAVRSVELRVLGSIIKYLPFFAVYYVIQSIIINNGVAAKRREVWNYLLAIAVSVGGLALMLVVYYLGALGGANLFGQSLLPIVSLMMVPLLALSAVISRLTYNKTGTIWLGAILNTVLMTALLCAGTVTLY